MFNVNLSVLACFEEFKQRLFIYCNFEMCVLVCSMGWAACGSCQNCNPDIKSYINVSVPVVSM